MIERLVLAGVLALLGLGGYYLLRRVALGRAAARSLADPLLSNYRAGLPGVMLFTADYCAPCKFQQRPNIQRALDQIGAERVQFIQVDVQQDPDAAQRWGVMSLPTTYILDTEGRPREVHHGVVSAERLHAQILSVSKGA
ncbi:MAG: thioredoxin family protein [Anaerolineales bacterium]